MSDAKKLDSAPEAPLPRDPQLFDAPAVATEPLGAIISSEPTLLNVPPPTQISEPLRMRRAAVRVLIFFLLGLVMFGLGAALTVALVTGALDAHTAQLKELMHQLKDLMHHSTAK